MLSVELLPSGEDALFVLVQGICTFPYDWSPNIEDNQMSCYVGHPGKMTMMAGRRIRMSEDLFYISLLCRKIRAASSSRSSDMRNYQKLLPLVHFSREAPICLDAVRAWLTADGIIEEDA